MGRRRARETGIKITRDHLALLAALAENLRAEGDFGFVPEFDAKRPFGNSTRPIVGADAAEILGGSRDDEEAQERALLLLSQCTPVLKHILLHADLVVLVGEDALD